MWFFLCVCVSKTTGDYEGEGKRKMREGYNVSGLYFCNTLQGLIHVQILSQAEFFDFFILTKLVDW